MYVARADNYQITDTSFFKQIGSICLEAVVVSIIRAEVARLQPRHGFISLQPPYNGQHTLCFVLPLETVGCDFYRLILLPFSARMRRHNPCSSLLLSICSHTSETKWYPSLGSIKQLDLRI
jgi:hypothetical protein